MPAVIVVAAVALLDADRRMITVRKRGTTKFMNPGGKPEPGESPTAAAVRELDEELGVRLDAESLFPLGTWSAPAANEPDTTVVAHAFHAQLPAEATPRVAAEIDELRRVRPDDIAALLADDPDRARADYAPLLLDHFLPALLHRISSAASRPIPEP